MPLDSNRVCIGELIPAEIEELSHIRGTIFDIQRYCLHDGPGLRTNVFFKGCPLVCGWCSNPESQNSQPELALFQTSCFNCGQFDPNCPECWGPPPQGDEYEAWLQEFSHRADLCPVSAIRWMGYESTAGEVIDEVLRDLPFYANEGGLTLTGGEPTMQPAFTHALLQLAKVNGLLTAIETCGYTSWQVFERLLPCLDEVLFDVKHVDGNVHLKDTGKPNDLILQNLKKLDEAHVSLRVRVPVIPGFNADENDQRTIASFLRDNYSFRAVDLLPYHALGRPKYKALKRIFLWSDYQRFSNEEIDEKAEIWRSLGFDVNIGG